ncbi:MAG TPA: hypothetical protein DCK76_10895 [Desulfotomaculum sp.]|nr:hypothetical protein [Desulfotomaculum sp.]
MLITTYLIPPADLVLSSSPKIEENIFFTRNKYKKAKRLKNFNTGGFFMNIAGDYDCSLVAPCGIFCGECPLFKANDNPEMLEDAKAKGYNISPCPGCRSIKGNCPVLETQCETFACANGHEVVFCFDCPDFPCVKLNPAADGADVLPHNIKVFNLCHIKQKGLEKFLEEAAHIKNRYYNGKIMIGKGPRID